MIINLLIFFKGSLRLKIKLIGVKHGLKSSNMKILSYNAEFSE